MIPRAAPTGAAGSRLLARVGLIATAVLVVGDLALRLAPLVAGDSGGIAVFGTALIAAGCGCVAGLLVRLAPAGALVAASAASALAALDVVGIAQFERTLLDPARWRPWLSLAELALLGAAGVAGAGAIVIASGERRRLRRAVVVFAVGGVVVIATFAIAVVVTPPVPGVDGSPDSVGLRNSGRAALGFCALALAVALGLAGRAPVGRARTTSSAAGSTAYGSTGSGRLATFGTVLADELLRRPSRGQVETEERARLAADIHARLLPGLRRAALAANEPGVPASVADGLRAAVSDAESLMEARESVVLEAFGLVPALEWLAERTEDRDGVEVAIDLDQAGAAADPPRAIARAAFRVALLAVDNAVRHGRPSAIAIVLRGEAGTGRLSISDDGSGIAAGRPGTSGRGIRDMTSLAASIGGSLAVRRGPQRRGTTVEITWPTRDAGNPATAMRGTTDGAPERPT